MVKAIKGLIIAAPHSGSGKTLVTLGLCRALQRGGVSIAPAKSGPDYIDPHFLSQAARQTCVNLDAWAMTEDRVQTCAARHSKNHDLLLIEGVMGLFDGAQSGGGSTADLAAMLNLPVVLVIDASHIAQSVAAIALGFISFRTDVRITGVILNRVASDKHEAMLRDALKERSIRCFGAVRRDVNLRVPSRHLGLFLPDDITDVETIIDTAAERLHEQVDINMLLAFAGQVEHQTSTSCLTPLGQHIAIAKDAAFSFVYEHWLCDWQAQGATISLFSPLADERPHPDADAIFLPGGYPELHGARLSQATEFAGGMKLARDSGTLIYGECGGYMVLGETLTDKEGTTYPMLGLLPHATKINKPRRTLGYRNISHDGVLPFASKLRAHEFHYSTQSGGGEKSLFQATDASGQELGPMGSVVGNVCGSYAHIIDEVRR